MQDKRSETKLQVSLMFSGTVNVDIRSILIPTGVIEP